MPLYGVGRSARRWLLHLDHVRWLGWTHQSSEDIECDTPRPPRNASPWFHPRSAGTGIHDVRELGMTPFGILCALFALFFLPIYLYFLRAYIERRLCTIYHMVVGGMASMVHLLARTMILWWILVALQHVSWACEEARKTQLCNGHCNATAHTQTCMCMAQYQTCLEETHCYQQERDAFLVLACETYQCPLPACAPQNTTTSSSFASEPSDVAVMFAVLMLVAIPLLLAVYACCQRDVLA